MKAEPLKDKEIRNAPKLTCYIENTGMFRKDDVASAVAWLKEEIGKYHNGIHPKCRICKIIDKIDEAFADVVKE